MAASMTSMQTMNSFTRVLMYVHEASTHSGAMIVVSSTSSTLMPSTPSA